MSAYILDLSLGMHGFQQGTQCMPSQYVPTTSLQAAGQMTG